MSLAPTNIYRNRVTPVVVGCTGVGVSESALFQKIFEVTGAPGAMQLGILNVSGVFSALQFNIEWSPTNGSGQYFEVVGIWTPLTQGVGIFPISEAGYYRLNCTVFTGGTSVDVSATVGLPSAGQTSSSGPTADVNLVGSTITLPVSITGQPIAVTGGGGGIQYTDGDAETAGAFTITVAGLYNGTDVVGLRGDASNNLLTNINVALPAGTNVIGHVITDSGSTTAVTGTVAVSNFPATVAVTQSTSPWVVSLTSTTITGTVAVTQSTSPWVVNLTQVGSAAFALGQQLAAASLPVVLTAAQITTLTPPTAAAIGTAVSGDLLIGTQLAAASVPVALPTATITTLTPPTAAAIAAAIVANPPTTFNGVVTNAGTFAVQAAQSGTWNIGTVATITNPVTVTGTVSVTQSTSPWVVSLTSTTITGNVSVVGTDADNATNSTTKLPVIPARANAAAPSWTEGHEVPLSVDLSGALRVNSSGSSGTQYNNGDTVATPVGTVAFGFDGTDVWALPLDASTHYLQVDLKTPIPAGTNVIGHVITDSGSTTVVTGTVAVTQSTSPWVVSLTSTTITGTVAVTQSGNWTTRIVGNAGAVLDAVLGATKPANVFQVGGNDGTNAYAVPLASGGGSVVVSGTVAATQSGTWNIGTVTTVSTVTAVTAITNALPAGTNLLGKIEITDGTNTAAVKAASVAATATDPALVVTTPGSTTGSSPANTSVTSTTSNILSANVARRQVIIVNTDVVVVYLALGQTPTATAYHVPLSPCSVAHDGTGGTFISDIWKGQVNAIVASTSGHVSVTELT